MKLQNPHAIFQAAFTVAAFTVGTSCLHADESVMRYEGQLLQVQGNGDEVIQREFGCILIDGPSSSFFLVIDSEEGCPWPDAFGTATNAAGGGVTPHLLYRFDGTPYIISLPDLKMKLPDNLNQASNWDIGNWNWQVAGQLDRDEKTVRLIAKERRGRKQTAAFDRNTGWLTEAKLDVFMGRGEKFQLLLKRTSVDKVPNALQAHLLGAQEKLLKLQADLNRRPDGQRSDLTARQIRLAESTLQQLQDAPETLPLQPLLSRIAKQVAMQSSNMKAAASAKADMLNRTISNFTMTQLNGRPFDSTTLKEKPTVLHFWSYSQNALEEPYGQVAYLEFIKTRRTQDHLNVIGIITNPLVQSAEHQTVELRSARKVTEFMNLSYPVVYDDGQLQKQCDPTSSAGNDSPVWIVLDATGKVVHYHQGFYEVDRRHGLKELADVLDSITPKTE